MDRFLVGMGALVWVGCADPCFDDGLAQGGCPQDGTQGETSVATVTASGGVTLTSTSASGTQGGTASASSTATGGTAATETATVTATMGTMTAGTVGATEDATATESDGETMSGTGPVMCPELRRVLVPQTPTVLLVIDQSWSMNANFDGSNSRWEALRQTLIDPTDGVVVALQSYVRFGVTLYTGDEEMCPDITNLAPQLDASDEIEALFDVSGPAAETPTGESLQLATAFLLADSWEGDKVMVLATDGEPDTCANPGPMEGEERDAVRALAVEAVSEAYDEGIRTFVISVGDEIGEEHLQDLANAGVGQDSSGTASFYTALDSASLAESFEEIIAGVRSCALELEGSLPSRFAPSCTVTVNDTELTYEDPDGWVLEDEETSIQLQGDACRAIQEGVVSIEMTCTCEVGG